MKKIHSLIFAILVVALYINLAASEPTKVDNFKLKDYNGIEYQLSDFKDSKAIVVMFIATQCPVSNDYNSRMAELFKNYKDKEIAFVGINSNKQESVEEIKGHAKDNNLGFVILKDWNNVIADKFQASFTPEVYVLNSDFGILYHGRIDDSRRRDNIKNHDLITALDEVLAGKEVTTTKTKAFGCTIKRVN